MTDNSRVETVSKPSTAGKLELRRLLLEQFYEDSVDRHGFDHEQVRILSRLLIASPTHKSA